ncbi:MAG: phage tail protein [Bilophila wadsworthia]
MQIGSLGDIVFEVNIPGAGRTFTPSALSMESAARFEEHQVLGAPPREFLAPELDVFDLSILLRADFRPVDSEIERLRTLCREGKAQRLILAGRNRGNYVLEHVAVDGIRSVGARMYSAYVTLSLKEYL